MNPYTDLRFREKNKGKSNHVMTTYVTKIWLNAKYKQEYPHGYIIKAPYIEFGKLFNCYIAENITKFINTLNHENIHVCLDMMGLLEESHLFDNLGDMDGSAFELYDKGM